MPISPFEFQSFEFQSHVPFEPCGDMDEFLGQLPPRGAVYLLGDARDRPVQLLSVGNLRASLKRRLAEPPGDEPTRRVDYRQLIRHVHFTRVDSPFEMDWVFLEAARAIFPSTYRQIVGFHLPWFIHVDPQERFPRYVRTQSLSRRGAYFGPLQDKQLAARLIEQVEDWFDLCRYHNVLLQSPRGTPCAYKEMGKCPAPCDGSIGLEQYRRMIDWSAQVLGDPAPMIREQTVRMQRAAAELRFEIAGRIKTYIDALSQLLSGRYRHVRALEDFVYLSIQRGPRRQTFKIFLITPGNIQSLACLPCLPRLPGQLDELLDLAGRRAAHIPSRLDEAGVERLGVAAHHLLGKKTTAGMFLSLEEADARRVREALGDLWKRTPSVKQVASDDGEGLNRQVSAIDEPGQASERRKR